MNSLGNKRYLSPILICFIAAASALAGQPASTKPNVLLIISDDLRNWIGSYGDTQAHTPNLDRLAARGTVFKNALCAAPLCNPSRTALLTGMRPSETGVYNNNGLLMSEAIPDAVTLPLYFKNHGYYVSGAGKITHDVTPGGSVRVSDWDDFGPAKLGKNKPTVQVNDFKWTVVPNQKESELEDYAFTSYIVDRLKKKHDKPFFLACGLRRPHVAWNVPEKYFKLHPLHDIKQPAIKADDLDDVPPLGRKMALAHYDDKAIRAIPQGPEKLIQAYRAAISSMDAQVGRLLDALDAGPAKDNTIIILIGDNGWNHGEKQHWAKEVLWRESTEVPMLWVVPGLTKPNTVSAQPVDFLSIFPTLCELAGLPIPGKCKGPSLRPLLADSQATWEYPAMSTMGRGNHALCDQRFRYIRYSDGTEELYDHTTDPNEWTNIASHPETAPIKARFAKYLPVTEAATKGKQNDKQGKAKGNAEQ
jgi:iduronate 2-sulfatase